MNFNTLGFSTPRALAFATVAAVAGLGIASGVFGTFSTTIITSQSCTGYGYFGSYGYGYDCVSYGGGGGGGGSYVTTTTPVSSGTLTPTVTPSVVVFTNFTAKCGNEVENLTDSRLASYYGEIGVVNKSNTGRKLTRAEFLKLVLNSAGVDVSAETAPTAYSDVTSAHSLNQYIAYATRNGIVSGSNGTFRPDAQISRAEAAKVLVRGANLGLSSVVSTFSDVSSTSSLGAYIQTAYDNCILHGRKTLNGETTVATHVFEPADGITLAETIKVLYNINK